MRMNANCCTALLFSLAGLAGAQTVTSTTNHPTQPTKPTVLGTKTSISQLPASLTTTEKPISATKNGLIPGAKVGQVNNQNNGNNTGRVARIGGTATPDAFPAFASAQRPTKQHLNLTLSFLGEWTTTTNAWNAPDTAASTTTGRARFFPTMGGRFVCGDQQGELFGKPFNSTGFLGFNTTQNRYEASWVNTESTEINTFTGIKTGDNTFTWTGTATSPVTGKLGTSRTTTIFNGKESFTYTYYTAGANGQEFKVYETTYNRVSLGGPFAIRPVYGKTPNTFGQNQTGQNGTFFPTKTSDKAISRTSNAGEQQQALPGEK